MHYHDPDRPRSAGGLPQFLPPGWGIIPGLELRFDVLPSLDGSFGVEISGWFLTDPRSASRRSIEINLIDLQLFVELWLNDPEEVAMIRFGYSGPRAAEPPGATRASGAPTLEDLDL